MSKEHTGQPTGGEPAAGAPPAGAPAAGAPASAEHPAAITTPWSAVQGVYKVGEGDKATEWYNTIPEEPVRETIKAKNYANPNEVAMAYHNLLKLQNGNPDVIAAPKWDDPKSVDAFFNKIGRPETADKYEFKFPDGSKQDEQLVGVAKNMFHAMGVPAAKAQAGIDMWEKYVADTQAASLAAEQTANDAALATLQTKWGAQTEEYKAAGNRTVKALGLSNDLIAKIEANIGSAAIVELLATIGSKSKEGAFVGEGSGQGDPNNPDTMSPAQAASRITALQSDAAFQAKYTNKTDPGHAEALALMEKLFAKSSTKAAVK